MENRWKLNDNTKNYLMRYYEILDYMIKEMTSVELTNSISQNFILQMIPHHMAAIRMSKNILQYTPYPPLQSIAKNIIEEQTKSVRNMQNVLPQCSKCQNAQTDLYLYQRLFHGIAKTMFTNMENAAVTNNVSADFMREMIPHHEGAVQMSENALRFPICTELVPILLAIIQSQKRGIKKMNYLLSRI